MRKPDALLLAYPTLYFGASPSTSRVGGGRQPMPLLLLTDAGCAQTVFMMDPIAPMNLLKQCVSMYFPSHVSPPLSSSRTRLPGPTRAPARPG